MNEALDPQVILYLGPQSPSKTRQILRTIPANPRSLIVTLHDDPYAFRLAYAETLPCGCLSSMRTLHNARHVRIAGFSNWQKAVFGERVYDRIFFQDLPDAFGTKGAAEEQIQALARLALSRSADVLVSLNFDEAESISSWEAGLPFAWNGKDQSLGFWINALEAPLRYLRLAATRALKAFPQDQIRPFFV